jgi:hypothetical protein
LFLHDSGSPRERSAGQGPVCKRYARGANTDLFDTALLNADLFDAAVSNADLFDTDLSAVQDREHPAGSVDPGLAAADPAGCGVHRQSLASGAGRDK